MNLFMPTYSIYSSVMCLDDKRLLKQILECKTIYNVYNRLSTGYSHHPVVKHYTQDTDHFNFAMYYAAQCCVEYTYRFSKFHRYHELFMMITQNAKFKNLDPIYVEGARSTTDPKEVVESFKVKLNKKWSISKTPPKWTRRSPPSFYTGNLDSQLYTGTGKEVKK